MCATFVHHKMGETIKSIILDRFLYSKEENMQLIFPKHYYIMGMECTVSYSTWEAGQTDSIVLLALDHSELHLNLT